MGQGLAVKRRVNRVVARTEFLSELCGGSLRTLRLEALDLAATQKTLTAEFAEEGRGVRGENHIEPIL
jgi:hypothetical protein